MKVLYDHQIFASQEYGGISRYFVEVGERLAQMPETDAHVLCPLYVNAFLAEARFLRVHGRHIVRPRHSAVAMRTLDALLSCVFVGARRGVDVYHETYFTRMDLAPRGAARVVTVHDMVHELFPQSFPALDRTRFAKRAAIRRADHVVCVSENTRRTLLEQFDLPEERVSVVYHGTSLQRSRNLAPMAPLSQLLYVGGRAGYKNFDAFVRAFAASRLPREGFCVLCFGGGTFNAQERSLLESLGIAARVRQEGGSDATLATHLATSTALVYPSLYEGFGIPPLEAMACGCAVIASDSSSIPEVTGEAAESFSPTDLDALRTALEAVAFSTERRAHLIDAGYRRAALFSWDRAAEQTRDAYRKAQAAR